MTHTLHRRGTIESLSRDFIVLGMTAKGFNEVGSNEALKEFLRILTKHGPVNIGDTKTGCQWAVGQEAVIGNIQDTSVAAGVFTDPQKVIAVLKDLKEAELGISVVVSGIADHVHEAALEAGIKRHTVEYSVGIKGNLAKLPEEEILEITTMCGHGMVSQHLARQMLLDIKRNKITPQEAGEFLATPCVCGVFNPRRAQKLLEELAEIWCFDEE
ncbi:MAG: hypothetical protein ACYCVD_14540 [Desulfitobacteriaceae bacterium]